MVLEKTDHRFRTADTGPAAPRAQGKTPDDLARPAVEKVDTLGVGYPKTSVSSFQRGAHQVAAQAGGIERRLHVMDGPAACRIKAVEPLGSGEPDRPGAVLTDVSDLAVQPPGSIAGKSFRGRVVAVQKAVRSDPEHARAVFEERIDIAAAETFGILCIVAELAKVIAVVALQAILGTEPQKSQIVLHDAADAVVRGPFSERQMRKTPSKALRHRKPVSVAGRGGLRPTGANQQTHRKPRRTPKQRFDCGGGHFGSRRTSAVTLRLERCS